MEAWYSKCNEAGLNLSAKDLTNKVFISITNNDTVMWYTMHIFYIYFYVPAVSTHILLCLSRSRNRESCTVSALWQPWLINVEYSTSN